MRATQTTKMRGRPGQTKNWRPPTFTVAPSSASVFAGGTIQFTATDPDIGDTLTYSLVAPPSGYSINSSTGLVTCGSAGATITVRATDSRQLYAQTTCSVTIGGAQWSGTSTVNLGTRAQGTTVDLVALGYAIVPVGSSPQFLIVSPASGFSVTQTTGILSVGGSTTPSTYNVVISLSDSGGSATNRTFTVVVSASTGSATLTWDAPTTNSAGQSFDGSTNDRTLVGHRIYYGTSQASVVAGTSSYVNVLMPTLTHTFTGLAIGPWYFRICAYDGDGDLSPGTTVYSKVIA